VGDGGGMGLRRPPCVGSGAVGRPPGLGALLLNCSPERDNHPGSSKAPVIARLNPMVRDRRDRYRAGAII